MNIILAKGSNPVLLNFQTQLQVRYLEYQSVSHNNSLPRYPTLLRYGDASENAGSRQAGRTVFERRPPPRTRDCTGTTAELGRCAPRFAIDSAILLSWRIRVWENPGASPPRTRDFAPLGCASGSRQAGRTVLRATAIPLRYASGTQSGSRGR
jgi:hypothetical protein